MSIAQLDQESHLAELLLTSDTKYFELGAEFLACDGACIAFVPGMTSMPTGCVALRLDTKRAERDSRSWLAKLETSFRKCGAALARTYLDRGTRMLQRIFVQGRYSPKLEIGFLATPQADARTHVQLRKVVDGSKWSQKLQIHRETDIGADGYTAPAEMWTELIRRKWLTGRKDSYLIECRGKVVGTIGALDTGPLLRIKNVLILPEFRRKGMASGALQRLRQVACQAGKAAVGVFAIANTPGHALYRSRGFRAVTEQVEWTRKLV